MIRKTALATASGVLARVSEAIAQQGPWQEIAVQGQASSRKTRFLYEAPDFDLAHYTPVPSRTPPNPPPVSSFEQAMPSWWPRVPTYPSRDSWRGGIKGPLR
jgi:hypothetical protein